MGLIAYTVRQPGKPANPMRCRSRFQLTQTFGRQEWLSRAALGKNTLVASTASVVIAHLEVVRHETGLVGFLGILWTGVMVLELLEFLKLSKRESLDLLHQQRPRCSHPTARRHLVY